MAWIVDGASGEPVEVCRSDNAASLKGRALYEGSAVRVERVPLLRMLLSLSRRFPRRNPALEAVMVSIMAGSIPAAASGDRGWPWGLLDSAHRYFKE